MVCAVRGGARRTSLFAAPTHMPMLAEECRAVQERVGLLETSNYGKIEIFGPGAEEWLRE